ncbi:hypothetical protein ABZT17_31050 [Streptomyces sp. NPDC005648]|uniref:hypothetical protein n=1 Tax=Streptomyces sp. NPDC005648 TaxID=3157044 RepID=UPI0033B294FB
MANYSNASGWLGWDWGNVPAWVGAVLTSGSLIVASFTFWRSRRDQKREHASKVAAWISEEKGENGENLYFVNAANGGDGGAYEINVKDAMSGGLLSYIPELPAKGRTRKRIEKYPESWNPNLRISEVALTPSLEGSELRIRIADVPVGLELRDALGKRWRIDKDRNIKPMKDGSRTKPLPNL